MQQPTQTPPLPDLDLLRPRLAQLINSISTLTSHLIHSFHNSPPSSTIPPTLPFPDLLNRYSLLISQFNSLIGLISSQGDLERERDRPQEGGGAISQGKRRKEERDTKRDRWAGVSIVPREPVEESKDWIVGLLLRTKQVEHTSLILSPPDTDRDLLMCDCVRLQKLRIVKLNYSNLCHLNSNPHSLPHHRIHQNSPTF